MKYAENTTVSVPKSKAEIEDVVTRYGASGFISGWWENQSMISFEMKNRRIRFTLPLPDKADHRFTHSKRKGAYYETKLTPEQAIARWEQECRQRWRALLLTVKAKLEAVESGIATFDEEFLSHIVTSNGMTIGESLLPKLSEICSSGVLPPMLPGPGQSQSN